MPNTSGAEKEYLNFLEQPKVNGTTPIQADVTDTIDDIDISTSQSDDIQQTSSNIGVVSTDDIPRNNKYFRMDNHLHGIDVGSFVLVKLKNYPWWPAKIVKKNILV